MSCVDSVVFTSIVLSASITWLFSLWFHLLYHEYEEVLSVTGYILVNERVYNRNSFPSLFYLIYVVILMATGSLICWLTTQNYDIELTKEH